MAGGGVNRVPVQASVPGGGGVAVDVNVINTPNVSVTNTVTVTEAAKTLFTNFGANATINVKAAAGSVFSLACENRNAAVRYFQLHNTAGAPANGTTPVYTLAVPGNGIAVFGEDFFSMRGHAFTNGIGFGFSTTMATMTAGTASEQTVHIHYL